MSDRWKPLDPDAAEPTPAPGPAPRVRVSRSYRWRPADARGSLDLLRDAEAGDADGLRGSVARGAGATALAFGLTQVLYFLIYIVLAHLTTPAVFGTYAAGSVLLAVGVILTESGMAAAVIQRRDKVEEAAATAVISTAIGGLGLALLALALTPAVGYIFDREIAIVSAVLSGTLFIGALATVPSAMLQRRISARRWVLVEPFAVAALGIASAAGLLAGLEVWGLVLGWYASVVTRTVGIWLAVGWRPQFALASWAMWKELAGFARHILASELLREAMRVGTTVAIGRWLGKAPLGEFRFGFRMVTYVSAPLLMANAWTLQPALVRLHDDAARTREFFLSSLRLVSFVAFPVAAAFIPLGEPIALVLFGSDWRGAGAVMSALALMGAAAAMESPPAEALKARGRPDLLPWLHALWAFSCLGLIAALVRYDAVGVALAWSFSTALVAITALLLVRQVVDISLSDVAQAVLRPLVCAAAVAFALLLIQRSAAWHPEANLETAGLLVAQILAGALGYGALIAAVDRRAIREARDTFVLMRTRRQAV